ncbi:CDC5 cell division cycle 5-like protein [Quaeritorhiza haematococci]|nr:CDC5 cell division cycle 5-like protein [Quaeritorhiza haematococci]
MSEPPMCITVYNISKKTNLSLGTSRITQRRKERLNDGNQRTRAAVMKYGKNQWARISSLLVRKSPKQCKARWYEWLDPSIKKTEWSKEEDEKLLHLAKLMPTQWRTIAPIVGRTPAQCLERYQKLLDEAEAKEGADEEGGVPTGDEVRRLRPGEIDPDPETKPARPDPVDMDEDEKEMLSEARARLANTQGKKAKRKAREKQLEEARRLASLQKRRELKAAGIEVRVKRKKRGMDYNADIPFHTKAPAGFWDTNDEKAREKEEKGKLTDVLLQKLEGKRRADEEAEERKKDAKRQKVRKEKGEYVPPQALRAAKEQEMMKSQRKKLILPAPQISENELEEIVKIGYAGETAKAIVDTEDATASRTLLGDYSTTFKPQNQLRTPRLTAAEDPLKIEARNLKALTTAQTPLLGGELNIEGQLSFDGITPRKSVTQTPNPLATNLTPRAGGEGGVGFTPRSTAMTPRGGTGGIMGRTPLRDQMGINTPRDSEYGFEETPRAERARQNLIRQQLTQHFATLPKPKNDFEIVLPDKTSEEAEEAGDRADAQPMEEDAADVEARKRHLQEQEEQARLRRRSQAVQRGLPRPTVIRASVFKADVDAEQLTERERINIMVQEEMLSLLQYDAVMHPAPGQQPHAILAKGDIRPLEPVTDAEMTAAQKLLEEEFALVKDEVEKRVDGENDDDSDTAFSKLHDEVIKRFVHLRPTADATARGKPGTFRVVSDVSPPDLVTGIRAEFDFSKDLMRKEATRAAKMEKKLGVMLGGYQARSAKLKRDLAEKTKELQDAVVELQSFQMLKDHESGGMPVRVEKLEGEVEYLRKRENELQQRYAEMMVERDDLIRAIQEGQRKIQEMDGGERGVTNGVEVNGANGNADEDVEMS